MSLMQTKKSSIDTSIYLLTRTAIHSFGRVGSLYDAYQDRLLGQLNVIDQEKLYQSHKLVRCKIIHGNNDRNQNLLRLLNIDEQLRLSILLKLVVDKLGIASIIDYPYPTNKYTRLLCYSYVNRIQRLPDRMEDARQFINSSMPQTKATHIINSIEWGIDLIVVFQLPSDAATRKDIDSVLKRVYTSLYSNYNTSSLIFDEESLLQKIIHIKVYSNIPDLCSMTTLYDICYYIEQHKNIRVNHPILYNLRSIQWFYPECTEIIGIFIPLSPNFNDNIEQYVFHLTADIKILETFINKNVPQLLNKHLKEQFFHIEKQWIDVKKKYTTEIDRISKLVIDIRSGRLQTLTINQIFQNHEEIIMKNYVRDLTQTLEYLEDKSNFITDLDRQQIQYYNINELNINQTDNLTTIEQKLIIDDECDRILCSNDSLNKNYPIQLNKLCSHLLEQLKNNPNLRILYADFSYSSFELHNMMILPSNKYNNEKNRPKQKRLSTSTKIETSIPPTPLITTDKIINILLLGETGVGKSTFINAFVNYFRFKTLKQAQSETPIALIPTSFVITVDNNLDKRTVKFGDFISSNNEDFNNPGQSVTQHCKSYVFHLDHGNGIKLRIIDTPGFGDIRGVDQDNLNIEHILEYIYNLNHLNAICFLFKSNALHLHTFFQSCLIQLFSLLYPDARNNIVFCFTNSRSTFYTSGNTTSLIENKLTSIPIGEIPFGEENIFCFDNEPFRYLVSLQNRIPFGDHEKQDYEMSWSMSVTEINRFIDYISKNLIAYQIRDDFQSIRHAQLKIIQMIRPILETIRNILRNTILWNMDSPNRSIQLHPKIFDCLPIVCNLCKPYPDQIGEFWIGNISLHHYIGNECRTCKCSLNQHIQIDYLIEYQLLNNSSKYDRNQMKDILDQLCHASIQFYHFLINIDHSTKDDPFIFGLIKMITEEKYITENFKPNYFNLQLVKDLEQLQNKYQQQKSDIGNNQFNTNLSNLYTLINTIREYPMVHEQLVAAREGRKIIMKQHEYQVSQHLTSTLIH